MVNVTPVQRNHITRARLLAVSALCSWSCHGGRVDSDTAEPSHVPPVGVIAEDCATLPASVIVGGGASEYEPLSAGDPATLVHGPQGGWHVLASGRIANTLNVVAITYTIHLLPEGTPLSWNQYRVQLVPFDPCTGDYAGMYGYLDVTALADGEADTPPELLEGRELELTLQVADSEGREASSSITVVGQLDPADVDEAGG